MASTINIYNMALGHIGSAATIADINESSAEARACRTFYDTCKNACLRDFRLPFSAAFQALAMVEEDPTTEWAFSYNYPNNCLFIRRIFSGIRNDTNDSRVPYIVGQDSNGQLLIYTDAEQAEIEFTAKSDNPVIYPPDFVLGLSYRLASYIAPLITKGDPFKLGDKSFQLYQYHMGRAVSSAGNEEQRDQQPESDFTRSRN